MKIFKQLSIIFAVCLLGHFVSLLLPFAFPASVVSMILMLLLMIMKIVKPKSIKQTAELLLGNMAFFFIPAGVNIIQHYELIKGDILTLLLICVISTFITFAVTAYTVVGVIKLMKKS